MLICFVRINAETVNSQETYPNIVPFFISLVIKSTAYANKIGGTKSIYIVDKVPEASKSKITNTMPITKQPAHIAFCQTYFAASSSFSKIYGINKENSIK